MNRLWKMLAPPRFHKEEENRIARILFITGLATFIALLVLILARHMGGSSELLWPFAVAAVIILLASIFLNHIKLSLAVNIILWTLLALIDFLIWHLNGIHDSTILAIPAILIVAGLVLDRIYFIVFTGACLLSVIGAGILALKGVLQSEFVIQATVVDIVDITVLLLISACLIRLISDELLKNLHRARSSEERYRKLVDASPDAIMILDEKFIISFASPKAYSFLGAREDEPLIGSILCRWMGSETLHEILVESMAKGADTTGVHKFETYLMDGTKIWVELSITVLRESKGKCYSLLLICRNISERKMWEEDLERRYVEEELISSISKRFIGYEGKEIDEGIQQGLVDLCSFTKTDRGGVFMMNDGAPFRLAFEWHIPESISGKDVYASIPQGAFKWTLSKLMEDDVLIINSLSDYPEDAFFERTTGERLGVKSTLAVSFRDRDGTIIGGINISQITGERRWTTDEIRLISTVGSIFANAIKKRQVDEKILKSLNEKELLLHEIHHRVKNNMQIITSLINMEAEKLGDSGFRAYFEGTIRRIYSMALVHEKMYDSKDMTSIDFREYLKAMMEELSHSIGLERFSWEIEADYVRFGIDKAIPCGLLVNELISNVLLYAFSDVDEGKLLIFLKRSENGTIHISLRGGAVAFPEEIVPGTDFSMGMTLINALTLQLRGKVAFDNKDGTIFSLSFPESD